MAARLLIGLLVYAVYMEGSREPSAEDLEIQAEDEAEYGAEFDAEETGTWEAIIDGPGDEHAHTTVTGTPETALEAAMARAVEKYGAQDWVQWRFRVEWQSRPPVLMTVRFIWGGGELRRRTTPPEARGSCT